MKAIVDLFRESHSQGLGMSWLAKQLLQLAAEQFVLVLEGVPTSSGGRELYTVGENPTHISLPRFSLFRSLLALFPSMAEPRSKADINPYSDQFRVAILQDDQLVHLEVDLVNTPSLQRLQIVRVSAPKGANPSMIPVPMKN